MGPYTVRLGDGTTVGMDGMIAEDIGLRPAKLSLDDIVFVTEVTSSPTAVNSPVQLTMLIDKFANIYEGIHLGKVEAQGFSVKSSMRDAFKVASLRIDKLENGRFGEISVAGFDGKPALGQPFKMGRAAVRGLDITGIMRLVSTEFSAPPGPPPSPDKIADKIADRIRAILALIEGIEIKDVAIPDPITRRLMQLDAFDVSWGEFVGGIPSRSRASFKFSVPHELPRSGALRQVAHRCRHKHAGGGSRCRIELVRGHPDRGPGPRNDGNRRYLRTVAQGVGQ